MRSKRTASTSPGIALWTKNGPVCGLPPRTRVTPFSSAPPASTVVVCTVSPGQIVSTGFVRDENSRSKAVGVNSWRFGGPDGRVGSRDAVHFRVSGVGLSFSEWTNVPDIVSPDSVPVYSSLLRSFVEMK